MSAPGGHAQAHAADGTAVAQAYAQNGAKVFISGRRKEVLDKAVQEIKAAGGKVDVIP